MGVTEGVVQILKLVTGFGEPDGYDVVAGCVRAPDRAHTRQVEFGGQGAGQCGALDHIAADIAHADEGNLHAITLLQEQAGAVQGNQSAPGDGVVGHAAGGDVERRSHG